MINKAASIDALRFQTPILLYMEATLQLNKSNRVITIKNADIIAII